MSEYRKCGKPDCYRKVSQSSLYCCHPCSTAAGGPEPFRIEPYRPGEHWVLVHGMECEERTAERGGAFTAGELRP